MIAPTPPKAYNEERIQNEWIAFLGIRGWTVMVTHGNMYQRGFPDLYVCHAKHGTRWVEVKNPRRFSFTVAQKKYFPKMAEAGAGIWVLFECSEEEYEKLFRPANWFLAMFVTPRSTG